MPEDNPSTTDTSPQMLVLQGNSISPGLALAPIHRKEFDLGKLPSRRVPNERIEEELNRFRSALELSRKELQAVKERMKGDLDEGEARIFDTHLSYLKDPIFIADVENLILNQQMNLEAAVAKVIADFDRIFKLVESEYLRERAVDLRDVAIRVLRNLAPVNAPAPSVAPSRYVLVAKQLSITDLFQLSNAKIEAVITEEGGMTSHAAILARSMQIPTVAGIKNLLAQAKEGDIALVDGNEGIVRLHPDEKTRAEYGLSLDAHNAEHIEVDSDWIEKPARTRDGSAIGLFASCSNAIEVEQAKNFRLEGVGLYRTEYSFMMERGVPSEETLSRHYKKVIDAMPDSPVIFRLLDVDSSVRWSGAPTSTEINPALGVKSLRRLWKDPELLRSQCRALLQASAGKTMRLLIPFVSGLDDLRKTKELLFEEKLQLRKNGIEVPEKFSIGVSIELPAAALLIRDFTREIDFAVVSLDNLVQYTLGADRGNEGLRDIFTHMHPGVLRLLRKLFEVAEGGDIEIFLAGETAMQAEYLPFLLGIGARRFSISPIASATFKESLAEQDLRECRKLAAEGIRASTVHEMEMLYQRFSRSSSY